MTAPAATSSPPVRVDVEVTADMIRAYARAVHEDAPIHHDADAARAAGFPDVVAPPMLAAIYNGVAVAGALADALADDPDGLDGVLHTGQDFVWSRTVHAGDVVTTEAQVVERSVRMGLRFFVIESVSSGAAGDEIARGTWTVMRRPA